MKIPSSEIGEIDGSSNVIIKEIISHFFKVTESGS